mgnify:CR=1 FL=1
MDNPVTTSVMISVAGAVLTIIGVMITVNRGTEENARQTGIIIQSIKGLENNINDLKTDMKDNSARLGTIENRLTKLETYVNNDDIRLKALEEKKK